jgi:hypothetical protein
MIFSLSSEQVAKFEEWQRELAAHYGPRYSGAVGGRYTFEFTPNGIGVAVRVIDFHTKQELDLTEFDSW